MKRLMFALAVVALGGLATAAMAGDYHVGTTLVCSDCHVMHGSQSHANKDGSVFNQPVGGPYPYLLRGETVNNACLGCHDGRTDVPDVLGDSPNPPTNGRRAGALNIDPANAHGITITGSYTTGDGHTLFATDAPPGVVGTPPVSTEGLECSDCHRVHGDKYYRNLQGYPNTTPPSYIPAAWQNKEVTYEIGGTPTDTVWVYEALAHNYDDANVNYEEKDQTRSAYGEWCGTCHGNFHGAPSSSNISDAAGEIVRHPTAGVDMTSSNITGWKNTDPLHRLKVMDATGKWDGTATTMTPSCFTCHKSHGNSNSFGLIYVLPNRSTGGPTPDPTRLATMTEQGDGGGTRDQCRNCHGQGSFPAGNPTNIVP